MVDTPLLTQILMLVKVFLSTADKALISKLYFREGDTKRRREELAFQEFLKPLCFLAAIRRRCFTWHPCGHPWRPDEQSRRAKHFRALPGGAETLVLPRIEPFSSS